MNLEAIPKMSQDFTPSYFDTGQFIWFNVKKSIELKALVSSHSSGIVLSELQFQDVNTIEEWELLEMKYNYKNQKNGQQ